MASSDEPSGRRKELRVPRELASERLDRFVTALLPELSRSAVQRLIDDGRVLVEGAAVRSSTRMVEGDAVTVEVPSPRPSATEPEAIPLDILYEDEHLLVVNKPAGMSVHPAGPLRKGTLVNALLAHGGGLSSVNGSARPGIVHRLDKDTSGLLMVARNDTTHRALAGQLEARTVTRRYIGICWGHPAGDEGRIHAPIARSRTERTKMAVCGEGHGRPATTHYKVAARYDFLSRLVLRLETGRTHQIRVHLSHIGHPVLGDPTYGGRQNRLKGVSPVYRGKAARILAMTERQMLHAEALGFVHPVTGEGLQFQVEAPQDMRLVLEELGRGG